MKLNSAGKMTDTDFNQEQALKKAREKYLADIFKTREGDICPYLDSCPLAMSGISALETFCLKFRDCAEKIRRDKFRIN